MPAVPMFKAEATGSLRTGSEDAIIASSAADKITLALPTLIPVCIAVLLRPIGNDTKLIGSKKEDNTILPIEELASVSFLALDLSIRSTK